MLLADKVAIVTGAAQGIGRATALRMAAEGARVVVSDINDDDGATVVSAIRGMGREAVYRSADVGERLDVFNLVTAAREAFGRVDVVVNNAATVDDVPFLELGEDELERVLKTNLKGAFLLSQAAARQMVRQLEADPNSTPGAIVNVTSVNAWFGLADHVAYSVSKGGLMQLTKSMALALAPHGIRVNAVAPGSIETPMVEAVLKSTKLKAAALARTPLGRLGTVEEIANVVVWLASREASYLTGTTVWADGGRMSLNTVMPVKVTE
ncbi:MAG: SDR family NAD(P)-dependent oxidoreductase [Pseudomonadota bacterium]